MDPAISHVTVLARHSPAPESLPPSTALPVATPLESKYTFIPHTDFLNYPKPVLEKIKDHNAVIWAMGKSMVGIPQDEYEKITHDFPVAALKAFKDAGVGRTEEGESGLRFVHISGRRADPTGNSSILFARVKGRAEADLSSIAKMSSTPQYPLSVHNLRPAYFFATHPYDAKNIRVGFQRIVDNVLRPVMRFVPPGPLYVPVNDLAVAALELAKGNVTDEVVENVRIIEIARAAKERK